MNCRPRGRPAKCLVSCTKGMRRLAGSGAGALLAFAAAGSWRSRCLNVRDVSEHAECDVLVVGGGRVVLGGGGVCAAGQAR